MEIKTVSKVLNANDAWAEENRRFLSERNIRMFSFLSSPGAGKTAFLEATINALGEKTPTAVIIAGPCTSRDAARIQKAGATVIQANTGSACCLEANLVHRALKEIPDIDETGLVFVENIGSLNCALEVDIGEEAKVTLWSVTEGEDKVEKYPLHFARARAVVITKTRLLPCTNFRMEYARRGLAQLNARCPVFAVDSLTSEGIEPWLEFIGHKRREPRKAAPPQTRGPRVKGQDNNLNIIM